MKINRRMLAVFLVGVSMLTAASCKSESVAEGGPGRVDSASPSSVARGELTITGAPSKERQERYGITVPAGATDVSHGFQKESGGGELWVTFKIGPEGRDLFLSSIGISEKDLNSGVVEFTSDDLDLTGWSIGNAQSVKGKMVPAKDDDMKSPSIKVVIDYSGVDVMTVYALSARP
ncbi:hypothetical protein ACIQ9P_12880 [Kitasatospora sp. NPDC094019]|uniref:hypothetical protein n=1 Tax=Kitasatospora sp. NPDC094019 TaxID=3364091 RepID=UPI00381F5D2E